MKSFVYRFGIFAVSIILLGGCATLSSFSTAQKERPLAPITDNPTGKHYPGKVVWHSLITSDPQLAGEFYQELFGWQIDYRGDYAIVHNGDKLIADILLVKPIAEQGRRGIWLPSVSVTDVDAAAALAVDNRGEILKGPADLTNRGRAVLIRDPQQADIILLKTNQGDPLETEAAMGGWLWDEIWTDKPQKIEPFYAAVLGYQNIPVSDGYDILISEGEWRAGVRLVDEGSTNKLWIPVVRVADPKAIVQRVEKLGGVVWVSPEEAPSTNTALIADTTGALLLIQRWPAKPSKMEQ